ncbi:hypothetical protein ECE50_015585 [Chitinophaga sp. Mgbs1]|uniref:Uncharacterized protein n=1 Tax=Chitinophaga solisilvae TaxID=1233460 RepID=A0A9Q5D1Z2_9BACT|nr:hypothetical protein [Chitinophaga solisilvae]
MLSEQDPDGEMQEGGFVINEYLGLTGYILHSCSRQSFMPLPTRGIRVLFPPV